MSERMSEENLHWLESNPSRITEGEALLIIRELIRLREIKAQRLFDLARHQRFQLLRASLISNEEYAWLSSGWALKDIESALRLAKGVKC